MMNGFDGGMMGGWGAFGWLWMLIPLLFWGGLLTLIVWAIIRVFPGQNNERREFQGESAEEILRARFARGEIEAEEYESSLQTLRGVRARKSKEPSSL
jgi:putative membrane protein